MRFVSFFQSILPLQPPEWKEQPDLPPIRWAAHNDKLHFLFHTIVIIWFCFHSSPSLYVYVCSGPRCVALFDYEGEEEDELTFSQGDVISLLQLIGQEWARGEIHGRVGIFPLNFTQLLEPPPQSGSSMAELTSKTSESKRATLCSWRYKVCPLYRICPGVHSSNVGSLLSVGLQNLSVRPAAVNNVTHCSSIMANYIVINQTIGVVCTLFKYIV